MGSKSSFYCNNCGYHTMVSGGWDCGFIAETVTIHCKTCNEILEASLNRDEVFNSNWDHVNKLRESGDLFKYFKCPNSKDEIHDIEAWGTASKKKHGNYICPKCSAKMQMGGVVMMWD